MTHVRRVALKISEAVVRWASPGCREWAEGLAREVDVIESDWAALGWALSGMRVLFDRREKQLASLGEASLAAESYFEKRTRQTVATYWVLAIFFVFYALLFRETLNMARVGSSITMLRVGFSMVLVAGLYTAYQTYVCRPREWGRRLDPYETAVRYRSDLQMVHEGQFDWRAYVLTSVSYGGALLFGFGGLMGSHGLNQFLFHSIFSTALFVLLPLIFGVQLYLKDRSNRHRIDELDALLAGRAEGAN